MSNLILKQICKDHYGFNYRFYTKNVYNNNNIKEESNFIVKSFFNNSLDNKSNNIISKIIGLKPVSYDLSSNILHNPNQDSKFKHIEVTEEHVRLEFSEINGIELLYFEYIMRY